MAKTKLRRALGFWEATLVGVGIILGAGIYVLIGKAAGLAGNAVWLSFFLVAIACTFTGLSYAELASMFPKAGAEYVYISQAFGKRLAWFIGWLLIIGGMLGAATVSLGFAGYFTALFQAPRLLVAATAILVCCLILVAGIKESAWVEIALTLLEAAGLVTIVLLGLPYLGRVDYLELANGIEGIFQAAALIFFAYIGFESVARLSEETRDPRRNIPLAIIASLAISTLLYIGVAIASVSVIGWRQLAESEAPLALVASVALGDEAFKLLTIIAIFATFNTILAVMLTTIRLIYGMASLKVLPRFLEHVSRGTRVPVEATLVTTLISLSFLLLGNLKTIASMTNFATLLTFALVNLSLVKFKIEGRKGKFSTPMLGKAPLIPLLGLLGSLAMLVCLETEAILYSLFLVGIGLFLYLAMDRSGMIKSS